MGDVSLSFDRREFACKCGCGFNAVDTELVEALEGLRQHFDAPITIVSGCRCREHNAKVGGVSKSQHVLAKAADIKVKGIPPATVYAYFDKCYPHGYGLGLYATWVHIDVRQVKSRWDMAKKGGE